MKSKILFVMHMTPPVHGAAVVGDYIKKSEYINSEFECRYINLAVANGVDDINKFRFSKLFDVISLTRKVVKEIRNFRPDIIYMTPNASGISFFKDFLILQSLKCAIGKDEIKIVLHFHNRGVKLFQDNPLYNYCYKKYFRGVKVMLLSRLLYDDVSKYVKIDDCLFCGNGIPDFAKMSDRKKNSSNVLKVLFLSNMMKEKGVSVLLDALVVARENGMKFKADFVGGWHDITPALFNEYISEHGLENVVEAHGPKYGEEKTRFFENADVFVFPTTYHKECFPLVLLEAMSYGLACISTDIAAIPDIIDDQKTGFVLHNENPKSGTMHLELAKCLKRLAENPAMSIDMGIAGRNRYEENYTLQNFESNFVKTLKSI